MLQRDTSQAMSPKEREEFEQEKEFALMQSEHSIRIKELELEVAKIEARWSVLFKIPLLIIKLPVLMLFAIAYIVAVARGKEPSKDFWDFIGK